MSWMREGKSQNQTLQLTNIRELRNSNALPVSGMIADPENERYTSNLSTS